MSEMSRIRESLTSELGDRAKQPLIYSDLGLRADLERAEEWGESGWRKVRDLEAEREILLRKAAAFDAMAKNGWYLYLWHGIEEHFWKVYCSDEETYIAEKGRGTTPLEAVECAVKGLEGR